MPLTLNPSAITFASAKSRVARAVGVVGDTEWETIAGDCIIEALHSWEVRRDWFWLYTTSAPITILASTSVYTLPSAFRKEFSARIGGQYLVWMPQRYYDRANPGNSGSGPYYYTMFNSATTGQIELLPPVGANVGSPAPQLIVRYWRKITKPVAGGDLLDIPEQYEAGIIALAKALLLMDKGGDDRRMLMWKARSDEILDRAIIDEERRGDYATSFVSESFQPQMGWNPNSLDLAIGYQGP